MRELQLAYVNGTQIGYGRLGVYLDQILTERGVDVYNRGEVAESMGTEEGVVFGNPYKAKGSPTNLSCLVSVPAHQLGFFDHQHRAIITMWEAMELPEAFRENLHEFETVIVPSQQNVELFSRYHPNVHLMNLGVDPKLWHYIPPPANDGREFRFLISGRGSRKGVDLAYRAFMEVFDGIDGPRLLIKSRNGSEPYWGSKIEQHTGTLPAVQERDLYASAHCYVQPSRGEGFGLQPLQALALGRPTILTAAHGHAGYSDLGIGIGSTHVHSDEFLFGEAGDWWEPDYDELCEAMWDVYKNYETHTKRAAESALTIAHSWTWEETTDRFIDILGPEMEKPYLGGGEWIPSTRQLFKVIANRDYTAIIAGRTLHFVEGKEYYESADVKRILFDNGVLAIECITMDDHGLAPQQVEDFELNRAHYEHCPTCGQMLNAGPTLADKIEREMAEAGM